MNQVHRGEFIDFYEGRETALIENKEFDRCKFKMVSLMPPQFLPTRTVIRNCSFTNCHLDKGNVFWSSVLEDVTVDGLTGSAYQIQMYDTLAFRHVTLKGKIRGMALMRSGTKDERAAAQELNETFYGQTDWALDISQAHFTSPPEFFGVPSEKVKVNGVSQVVISSDSLRRTSEEGLREVLDGKTLLGPMLALQAESPLLGYTSEVIVAPDSGPDAVKYQEEIELLRSAGLLAVGSRGAGFPFER